MTPSCTSNCEKLLELTLILIGTFATSSLKQCAPETTLTFRNVGIKLCQLKCTEYGGCLSFEYDIETLTCRLSTAESQNIEKKEGYISLSKNYSDVPSGPCASRNCSQGERCLKTRSGKRVCVQGEKLSPPQDEADKQDGSVENLLLEVCKNGDLGQLKCILSRNEVDVDCRDETGRTPLMLAARNGHSRIFSFLVGKGANTSHVNDKGLNVLHFACRGGSVGMVKDIVTRYGVDVNSRTKTGETALMTAVCYGHRDVSEYLVSKKANVSLVDRFHLTILHWACRGRHLDIVRYVISKYCIDVDSCGSQYSPSPLKQAALKGHKDVFDLLISKGANVSQVDTDGDNILHSACKGGHLGIVEYLISKCKIDINSRGKYGASPLMWAAYSGQQNIIDVLMSMGANVSQVDDDGDNIVHWFSRRRKVGMVNYMFTKYSFDINSKGNMGKTPLMYAAKLGHTDMFNVLVSLGANVSQVDDHGDNILHYATLGGHTKMVQHVIFHKLVNINSRGDCGWTPLMKAAWMGHRKVLDLLVSKGGITTLVDDQGYNILHLACMEKRMAMVKHIISQNMTDINARDKKGRTAAMIAKQLQYFGVYKLLVSRNSPQM